MKKNKLLGVLALSLSLGLAACGEGDSGNETGTDTPPTQECSKHTWGDKEVIKAATCTEGGQTQRTCTVCGKKEDPKNTSKLGHDYKDLEEGFVDSTCTQVGKKKQKCSRCNDVREVEVALKEHTWVNIEGGTAATCTDAGTQKQKCSVCDTERTVEVAALDHSYGDTVRTKNPTCEEAGNDARTCSRCGYVENTTVDALGHDFELVGGEVAPDPGKAAVRLYHCKTCGIEFLGFKASEVSAESEKTLVFETTTNEAGETVKTGARFFGRPIGNSLGLDPQTGDAVVHENNTIVYCKEETGDFFEYVFELDHDQAETLSTCRLYCDAKPANYLNGADFWAYAASSDDWTPGYYIDDKPEHIQTDSEGQVIMTENHARCERDSDAVGDPTGQQVPFGKRITDYRYVLYVDNPSTGELEIQQFDPDTAVPTEGRNEDMKRKEYVLPYTFHLHEGTNKISLRMAGGYRSMFYNFTFRPYVAPTPITVNESTLEVREGKTIAITGASEEGVTYTSSNTNIATVDANGVVTGVKAGNATITVSKEGNFKDAKVPVTVLEREGVVALDIFNAVVAPAEGGIEVYNSSSSGKWYRNPKNGTTLTYTFQSELAGKFDINLGLRNNASAIDLSTSMGIKVNDADVTVTGSVQTQYDPVEYVVGQADLNVGNNTMVISFPADSALYIKSIKLVPHVHNYGDVTEVAAVDGGAMKHGEATCACGAKRVSLGALDGTFAAGSSNKTGTPVPPEGFLKLNGNGNSISYNFSAAAAGKATFAVEAVMDNFQGGNGSNNTRKLTDGKGNGKPYNITFTVGYKDGEEDKTNDVDMSGIATKTYDELFDKVPDGQTPIMEKHSAITTFEIGTADVGAGMNTLTITRNGSYNFIIRTIYVIL